MRSILRWVVALATAVATACSGGPAAAPGGASDAAAAVDHVAETLVGAGRRPPAVTGLVRYACGPTDAVLGVAVADDPATVPIAWAEVAPVVAPRGRELPPPEDDPLAGAPAHVDEVEVAGDGWTVRWGRSLVTTTDEGDEATVVTVVDGGEVDGQDLDRWAADRTVVDVLPCG